MAHGSSPAAWTSITLALIGFVIGGIGLIPTPHWTIFTVGVVIVLLSGPIALGMGMAGFGAPKEEAHR